MQKQTRKGEKLVFVCVALMPLFERQNSDVESTNRVLLILTAVCLDLGLLRTSI